MTSELRSETSGSTVSLKNLTVAQLINKFSTYLNFRERANNCVRLFSGVLFKDAIKCYDYTDLGIDVEHWQDGSERGKLKFLEKLCQCHVVNNKLYVDCTGIEFETPR